MLPFGMMCNPVAGIHVLFHYQVESISFWVNPGIMLETDTEQAPLQIVISNLLCPDLVWVGVQLEIHAINGTFIVGWSWRCEHNCYLAQIDWKQSRGNGFSEVQRRYWWILTLWIAWFSGGSLACTRGRKDGRIRRETVLSMFWKRTSKLFPNSRIILLYSYSQRV